MTWEQKRQPKHWLASCKELGLKQKHSTEGHREPPSYTEKDFLSGAQRHFFNYKTYFTKETFFDVEKVFPDSVDSADMRTR